MTFYTGIDFGDVVMGGDVKVDTETSDSSDTATNTDMEIDTKPDNKIEPINTNTDIKIEPKSESDSKEDNGAKPEETASKTIESKITSSNTPCAPDMSEGDDPGLIVVNSSVAKVAHRHSMRNRVFYQNAGIKVFHNFLHIVKNAKKTGKVQL